MSTSPTPFGDPTKVDRENRSAVKKGLLFGCGGCALLGLLGVIFCAGIFAFVMVIMRSDETSQLTLQAAQASEVLKHDLGEPMRIGWFITGDINMSGANGSANITVPIIGPNGEATVHTIGNREAGVWEFSRMEATVKGTGETVDLRLRVKP